jgi:hypothetical protein
MSEKMLKNSRKNSEREKRGNNKKAECEKGAASKESNVTSNRIFPFFYVLIRRMKCSRSNKSVVTHQS